MIKMTYYKEQMRFRIHARDRINEAIRGNKGLDKKMFIYNSSFEYELSPKRMHKIMEEIEEMQNIDITKEKIKVRI